MPSDRSRAVGFHRPDVAALTAAPTRIVIAHGVQTGTTLLARTATAMTGLLGGQPAVFPSHHGGFLGADSGHPGQPQAFARRLREVLDVAPSGA